MTHHDQGAGPAHGPAHRGDLGSPEPGGYDEFDHAPADHAPTDRGPAGPGVGQPVVSDGTAVDGDAAEPSTRPTGTPGTGDVEPTTTEPTTTEPTTTEPTATTDGSGRHTDSHPDARLAAERLADLQRLQAEYVNYKKRVDRDRAVARELGIAHVLESLVPVLDDIHLAREHGDLETGPFAAIAEKLEHTLAKLGIERFGTPGEPFDPTVHEALMHTQADLDPSATTTTVVQVLQPGYRAGDRIVRAARVAVADPQ